MKTSLKSIGCVLAVVSIIITAKANDISFVKPNIPADLWEKRLEGISVAMTLRAKAEGQNSGNALLIYVKNASATVRKFSRNGADCGIKVFYTNNSGTQVPLRHYPSVSIDDHRFVPIALNPGEALCITIDITSEEAQLLKTHSVVCKFDASSSSETRDNVIESSPKMLQTVSDKSEK